MRRALIQSSVYLIGILLLIFAVSGSAFAQLSSSSRHDEWEFTMFAGHTASDSLEFGTVGMDYAAGGQVGVRINQNLREHWRAGMEYSLANRPLRFTNLSTAVPVLSLGHHAHTIAYDVAFAPLPRTNRFRPFVVAGGSAMFFRISSDSKDDASARGVTLQDSWAAAFNWGGGLKYLIWHPVAVTFDVRDRISRVPAYGLSDSVIDTEGVLHTTQVNLGVTFQWD